MLAAMAAGRSIPGFSRAPTMTAQAPPFDHNGKGVRARWHRVAQTLVTALALLLIVHVTPWRDRVVISEPQKDGGGTTENVGHSSPVVDTPKHSFRSVVVVEPGVFSLLAKVRGPWLAFFFACSATSAILLVARWRLIMSTTALDTPSLRWCGVVWARSQVINLLPLSQLGGDAYRIERSRMRLNGIIPAVGVILAERMIGILGLLTVLLLGVAWISQIPEYVAVILGSVTTSLFLAPCLERLTRGVAHRCRGFILPKIALLGSEMLGPLARLVHSPSRAVAVVGLSFGVHLLAPLSYLAVDRALGFDTPLWCYLIAIPAISLVVFLPFHVAGIGLVEGGLWLLLNRWSGATSAEVVAICVAFRVLALCWIVMLCTVFFRPTSGAAFSSSIRTRALGLLGPVHKPA